MIASLGQLSAFGSNNLRGRRAAALSGGYDADAQSYIDAVNAARTTEAVPLLSTEAKEIHNDAINLLNGNAAPHGRLTGYTPVDIWDNIQHLVNFRGAGNVGSGTAVIALKGENGAMMRGHPWDARGDGSNDYILFPSLTVGHNHSFLLNALAPTIGSYNAMWVLNPASGYAIDSLDGLAIAKAGSTSDVIGAYHDGTAGAAKFATSLNHSGESELAYTLTLDGGTGSIFEENSGAANSDTYTNSADIVPINMTYNCRMLNGSSPVSYLNSRPHVGLIVAQVLDATQRANVHAILKGWYEALQLSFRDDFDRADSATVGKGWEEKETGTSSFEIVGNQLKVNCPDGDFLSLFRSGLNTEDTYTVTYKGTGTALRFGTGVNNSLASDNVYLTMDGTEHSFTVTPYVADFWGIKRISSGTTFLDYFEISPSPSPLE
jgi:hypothetical protein